MVHARPRQGTGPAQHACCVHDEGNGGGAIGCTAPPMEAANGKAPRQERKAREVSQKGKIRKQVPARHHTRNIASRAGTNLN